MAAPVSVSQVPLDKDDRESLWLLVGGPSKIPKNMIKKACDKVRKKDDGSYANGINKDIKAMKKCIANNNNFSLYKTCKNKLKLKKSTVLKSITAMCKQAWLKPVAAVIYYSGYGLKGKGDWCFIDGTISITELLNAIPDPPQLAQAATATATATTVDDNKNNDQKTDEEQLQELMNKSAYAVYIISDCGYSGKWRKELRKVDSKLDIFFYGSVNGKKDLFSQDTKSGGKFTKYLLTGNKMLGMPEPVAIEVCNGLIFDSSGILWSDQVINQIKGSTHINVVGS